MKTSIGLIVAAGLAFGLGRTAWADDGAAVIDKAVKALGGADKLAAAKTSSWKVKGKITFGGNESDFTSTTTVQGLDHYRQEFEGEFGGNQVKGVTVIDGDKGWRKFGDNARKLENQGLENQKRAAYLQIVPATILPLKEKGFKVESVSEEKVGDKPAVALKVKGPDDKDFQIFFDKASGVPVKVVAVVAGRQGAENTQETTFADYKDFDGVKRATKIEIKRDGEKFMDQQLSEFRVLGKVEPSTFSEPQ